MLLSRRTESSTHCLCPYCGKLIELDTWDCVRDHVVPRALWRQFKTTTRFNEYMHGYSRYPLPENDYRNLVYCCRSCNLSKSNALYIPAWNGSAMFRHWGIYDLHEHADYFYRWSDVFIEYFTHQKYLYRTDSSYVLYCTNTTDKLTAFKSEYLRRLKENDWEIHSS